VPDRPHGQGERAGEEGDQGGLDHGQAAVLEQQVGAGQGGGGEQGGGGAE
jgi:hypothetical protein